MYFLDALNRVVFNFFLCCIFFIHKPDAAHSGSPHMLIFIYIIVIYAHIHVNIIIIIW